MNTNRNIALIVLGVLVGVGIAVAVFRKNNPATPPVATNAPMNPQPSAQPGTPGQFPPTQGAQQSPAQPMPGQPGNPMQGSTPNEQGPNGQMPGGQGHGVVPQGFQTYNDPQGTGMLIFAKFPVGQYTATVAMQRGLNYLQNYFDAPMQLLGAVSDQQNKTVQAMFRSTMQGQLVHGVAVSVIGATDGSFAILFDHAQTFSASYSRMAKQLGGMMPQGAQGGGGGEVSTANWQRQTTGDQSAAAYLPEGWRVTGCVNGALDIVGPRTQSIELGLAFPVFTSALPGYQGTVAPYMDPVNALKLYESNMNFNQLRQSSPTTFGRIIETTPVQDPNGGQGMYILQEADTPKGRRKLLAMVLTSQVAQNEWLLYISFVGGPSESFGPDLPTMLKIWGSWKVDDRVFQQRMQQALQSMRETSALITSSHDNQTRVYDNMNTAMDMVIRGNWPVENTQTGSRVELDQNTASALEKQCQAQGIPCQQVPINQLTGGH